MNEKYCNENINNYYWRSAGQIKMNNQQYRRRNGMKITNIYNVGSAIFNFPYLKCISQALSL